MKCISCHKLLCFWVSCAILVPNVCYQIPGRCSLVLWWSPQILRGIGEFTLLNLHYIYILYIYIIYIYILTVHNCSIFSTFIGLNSLWPFPMFAELIAWITNSGQTFRRMHQAPFLLCSRSSTTGPCTRYLQGVGGTVPCLSGCEIIQTTRRSPKRIACCWRPPQGSPLGIPRPTSRGPDALRDPRNAFYAFWEGRVYISPAPQGVAGLQACLLPAAELSQGQEAEIRGRATRAGLKWKQGSWGGAACASRDLLWVC